MALFGGRGGQKKTGNQRRKVKEQKKARDAQTAEAKAKARSKRSRPEEDEVVIVKASRAPDNSSADWLGKRSCGVGRLLSLDGSGIRLTS